MDRPISRGDFVVVVKPFKCGCAPYVGMPFVVTKVYECAIGSPYGCPQCGLRGNLESAFKYASGLGNQDVTVLSLKRIDPPAEPAHTESREEIHA